MIQIMHLKLFNNMPLPYSHFPYESSTPPSLRGQALIENREIFCRVGKSYITNKLAGFGKPAKSGREMGCKAFR